MEYVPGTCKRAMENRAASCDGLPVCVVDYDYKGATADMGRQRNWRGGACKVIYAAINGPDFAFVIPFPVLASPDNPNWMLYYDSQRLLGIGFFWFLIGLAIDRRHKPIFSSRYPSFAAFIFTLAAVAWGGLGCIAVYEISREAHSTWIVLTTHPLFSGRTIGVAWTLWILGFFGYFARKSFVAWKNLRV